MLKGALFVLVSNVEIRVSGLGADRARNVMASANTVILVIHIQLLIRSVNTIALLDCLTVKKSIESSQRASNSPSIASQYWLMEELMKVEEMRKYTTIA